MLKFLNSRAARIVTVILVLQAALLYSAVRPEIVPPSRPLASMPTTLGSWQLVQTGVIEQEVLDVLKADDILNGVYCSSASPDCPKTGQGAANLFVAAFRTQRNGKTPHSPKNCLPGSGWERISAGEMTIDVGRAAPITVNRYVVAYGSQRDLVLYWYQSRDRVVADEYKAKFWVMADAIRLNRTDTALVRVIVPLANKDEAKAQATATDFVKSFYSTLLDYLPS
ncbi:MAG TPA: EpsI family protein [Bryobacteraceae bacterium]|nr:EpsI family protein [Bryobacteraceae bacterium]